MFNNTLYMHYKYIYLILAGVCKKLTFTPFQLYNTTGEMPFLKSQVKLNLNLAIW